MANGAQKNSTIGEVDSSSLKDARLPSVVIRTIAIDVGKVLLNLSIKRVMEPCDADSVNFISTLENMDIKTIKGKEHFLYDNMKECMALAPKITPTGDWRRGKEGDWVYTDDLYVCQILKIFFITFVSVLSL